MKHILTILFLIPVICSAQIITNKLDTVYIRTGTKDTSITVTYPKTYTYTEVKPYKPIVTLPPATGKYFSLPFGTPRVYDNVSNLIIENLQFTNPSGHILHFKNCSNITIRNCYFGPSSGIAVAIEGGSNFTIERNLAANVATVFYAEKTTGNIRIINNQYVNTKGPMPRGQFVQFNTISGIGNLIEGNRGENFTGRSSSEDLISVYSSKGTVASPITIRNNIFRGGGPSESGGGLMSGDQFGQYILVEGNKLINPGHYGIGAGGGQDIIIRNNQVYADAANNIKQGSVGFFVANFGGGTCARITMSGNRSNWTMPSGTKQDFWNGLTCSASNLTAPTSITLAEMAIPAHLIDFITPAELNTIK